MTFIRRATPSIAERGTPDEFELFYNNDTDEVGYMDELDEFIPSSSIIIEKVVQLTANQLKNLNSEPIEAIPTPGANKAIEIIAASLDYTFGTIAFDNATITLNASTLPDYQFRKSNVLLATDDVFGLMQASGSTVVNMEYNDSIVVTADADSSTDGDGTAVIYIQYRIVTKP